MDRIVLTVLILIAVILCSCNRNPESNIGTGQTDYVIDKYIQQLKKTSNTDSLEYIIGNQLHELESSASDSVTAGYLKQVGMLYYNHSEYAKAAGYFHRSEQLYNRAGMKLQATQMLANQAVIKELRGNYKEAVKNYLRAAELFDQLGDSTSLASVWTNIGVVYEEMGLTSKAIYYDHKSLRLKLRMHDTLSAASNYNNLGVVYSELYDLPDSALFYYKKASEIYDRNKTPNFHRAQAKNNLGMVYIKLKKFELAKKNLTMAKSMFDTIGNVQGQATTQRYFGELFLAIGKYQQALEAFREAFELFKRIDDKKSQMEMGNLLSKVYIINGQYGDAAKIMQVCDALKDTLLSVESQAVIAEMETKYQVGEKNKTIRLLKLEKELHRKQIKNQTILISLLSVIFILLVLIFYFIYHKNKLNQKQLRLELQNYLLTVNKLQNEMEKKGDCFKFPENRIKEFELSDRETEVLKYIAQGYKNAQIAEKLFVSENTIKTHIKNIYTKLDVKNRVEALKKVDIV
jgi:ATP/maltotriose-dependent transcriptional regulator MalT